MIRKQHAWYLVPAGLAIAALPAVAAMPSVSIVSPGSGATVRSKDIPVVLSVRNFTLEGKDAGMPGKPGRGHVHVMLDGMDMEHLTNVEVSQHASVSGQGVKPGKHTLAVVLASDDHMPASKPAMIDFNYQPPTTQALPAPATAAGSPGITILSPEDGATVGRKFTLRVAVKNFELSCAEGKENVQGFGHLHVFVNQQGVTDQPSTMTMGGMKGMSGAGMSMVGMIAMPCESTIPVDLSAWKKGPAKLTVMLANNDHSMNVTGATPASVTINLR